MKPSVLLLILLYSVYIFSCEDSFTDLKDKLSNIEKGSEEYWSVREDIIKRASKMAAKKTKNYWEFKKKFDDLLSKYLDNE